MTACVNGKPRGALFKAILGGAVAASVLLSILPSAKAQQQTFHLDRLEMPGAPDDGVALFRPVTQPKPIFFAQLGLGYQLNPLHTVNIISDSDRGTRDRSSAGVIQHQLGTYATVGFQLADRVTLAATLPVAWWQTGEVPNFGTASPLGNPPRTAFRTSGPAVGDTRIDVRYVAWRSEDRQTALAPALSLYAPSGTSDNFGGEGQVSALIGVSAETAVKSIVLVGNTGVYFRPRNSINNPANDSGLGIGTEWRWGLGAFLPLKGGKLRLGASVFGQTGLEDDSGSSNPITGNTIFKGRNTPLEWNVEGRAKFGANDAWWVGLSAGTRILNGYGAPDFRTVAMIGVQIPIVDSNPKSPDRLRRDPRASNVDTDGDGIPDDIDACVNEPEDHKEPDPNDGCPAPTDRDGDGIPDNLDKCPDQPEDKDGIDDADGCPEDDADKDNIPDVSDACPKEPGKPSPDPKRNGCPTFISREGGIVRALQQVHFTPGSATILPDSFPMLQEIVDLLKSNPGIKKLRIEGHTDSDGGAAMNLILSKNRAAAVRKFLVDHGIEDSRLESEGYGLTQPIQPNTTAEGKAANRRVDFKILEEEDTNKVPTPPRR